MLTKLYVMMSVYLNALKEERGQGMAEYGLILALVALVVAVALSTLATNMSGLFSGITF